MSHQKLDSIPSESFEPAATDAIEHTDAIEQSASNLADNTTSHHPDSNATFKRLWKHSTADNNLTLYGFQRFKTSHLLNLRYLEEEISRVDHDIYQAGLRSGCVPGDRDRLGLRFSKTESSSSEGNESFDTRLILKLRDLLKDYDDALETFNKLMSMETFSLLDDESQCHERSDLHLYEMYQTRLLRVDIGRSSRGDPVQRMIHKWLRALRYRRLSAKSKEDEETAKARNKQRPAPAKYSYQNTVFLADVIFRLLMALFGSVFMVVPLVMISYQERQVAHLITVAVWIIAFSLLTSLVMKVSNHAIMGVVAAYAAILSVFVSNS